MKTPQAEAGELLSRLQGAGPASAALREHEIVHMLPGAGIEYVG
jgi:hypothetical protein